MDRTLGEWLEADGGLPGMGPGTIADAALVRARLIEAAMASRSVSYSELLATLGHRFTRPKMRALCKTLDAIDRVGTDVGEPALAVLVVREGDRLPGQGWWVGSGAQGYTGPWTGTEAAAHVAGLQQQAFDFWRDVGPFAPAT